jgi:hypothetical protein
METCVIPGRLKKALELILVTPFGIETMPAQLESLLVTDPFEI